MVIPQAPDIERSVLGAVLSEFETDLVEQLSENYFYIPRNNLVFKAISDVEKPDLLSVEQKLTDWGKLDEIGGINYLSDLCREASTSNTDYHIQILREKTILRNILDTANQTRNKVTNQTDAYELLDELNRKVESIDTGIQTPVALTPSQIFERDKNRPKAEKFYIGYSNVDHGIYGETNKRGQIEITIADSGHGKTQYALWKAMELQNQGYKIAWFQLEDYDSKTANLVDRNVKDEYIDNIFIIDKLYDIEDIKRELRMLNREHGIDYAVFDYVQNIECNQNISRTEKVEYISKQLTRMAKDLNLYCHALSQITINYDTRRGWNQEPGYGDVRWSQQLKQDAHIITSVFRPSQIESLCVNEKVKNWTDDLVPFNSVFIRQAKVRYGQKEWKRFHMINSEYGLKPFTPRGEAESVLKQLENDAGF